MHEVVGDTTQTKPHSPLRALQRIAWHPDRMLLDDLVFRLEHYRDDDSWELGDECFRFFKIKPLVDEYATFFGLREDFRPETVLELGIWDGGSVAFWFEVFQPRKHVAIDVALRDDSPYFRRYMDSRNLHRSIATFWGTDQGDAERLREIVAAELGGEIDLVIDDCSHLYGPTKTSFETLFPLLRPGGLYIVEDWAWGHWEEFQSPTHEWAEEPSLTQLVVEFVEAVGTSRRSLASVTVYPGFAAVERGPERSSSSFALDDAIVRRSFEHSVARPTARAPRSRPGVVALARRLATAAAASFATAWRKRRRS